MYQRLILVPYKMASKSCKYLQEQLKQLVDMPVWRIRPEKLKDIKDNSLVLFWGCKDNPAANKLSFFQEAAKKPELNIPEWTTDNTIAKEWTKKHNVLCRTSLTGHSGAGIHLADKPEEVIDAPLYVKYKKKKHEFRVHVFNGSVIDISQKKKRKDAEEVNTKIRNYQNGWVYCREDLNINNKNELISQALLACSVCNLDFGAVDVIYNEHENKYYVLEVNTAPGLEGQTGILYANAIKSYMEQQ